MKYRIVPDGIQGCFRVEQKAWFFWYLAAYATSIEEADRFVQQFVRDDLWKLAHKPVYYDEKGVRM